MIPWEITEAVIEKLVLYNDARFPERVPVDWVMLFFIVL
jgi:hypothetical protein